MFTSLECFPLRPKARGIALHTRAADGTPLLPRSYGVRNCTRSSRDSAGVLPGTALFREKSPLSPDDRWDKIGGREPVDGRIRDSISTQQGCSWSSRPQLVSVWGAAGRLRRIPDARPHETSLISSEVVPQADRVTDNDGPQSRAPTCQELDTILPSCHAKRCL